MTEIEAPAQKRFRLYQLSSSCLEDTLQSAQSSANKQEAAMSEDRRDAIEFAYTIRRSYQLEFDHYMKLVILKTSCIGLLVGFLVIMVLYDKLFFENHYYHKTREYQAGMFGFDIKTLQNLPNYDLTTQPYFDITSINQMSPNYQIIQPSDPTSYHQINDDNKKNKYNLQGQIVREMMLEIKEQGEISSNQLVTHLLEVIHNVNYRGEIVVEPSEFEVTKEQLEGKRKRIQKILAVEKERYDRRYQITKYMAHQLPFCVVVPSYNNYQSQLYLRNLDSIFMQDYQNYHVVYIDDASPDKTGEYVQKYIEEKGIAKEKIQVIINQKNLLAMANIYQAITNKCKSGEIVMLLDGDDSFLGRQVMSLFNAVYQQNKAALVYSTYLVITNNCRSGIGGSSRQIPGIFLEEKKFRQAKGFFTSHLLTFYADLFWKIKKEDLCYQNGTFFKFGYDVALVTPIIEMVNPRLKFVEQVTYEYRYDTGINDPGWGQIEVDNIVFSKQPYDRLTQFPFIENFYDQEEKDQKNKASKLTSNINSMNLN